jgi:hypothetical protein
MQHAQEADFIKNPSPSGTQVRADVRLGIGGAGQTVFSYA